jgi:hypothetical protein
VGSQNYSRALAAGVFNSWQRSTNARVVFNLAVLDWHVKVNADENAFAGKVQVFD